MRFELLSGKHTEGDVTYRHVKDKQTVVVSSVHLDKAFANKFRRLPDGESTDTFVQQLVTASGTVAVHGAEGVDADEIIRRILQQVPAPFTANQVVSALGQNVTEDFPKAEMADLLVLQQGTKFFVAELDRPDVALNPKAMKQNEVSGFLSEWLKSK